MASAVADLNDLLGEFESANKAVVIGTHAGDDITDKLDARDKILSQISEIIGVRAVPRGSNDVALYTDSGVTLFDGTARSVTFTASPGLAAGQAGNAVVVDGVPVTGSSATMPIKSGRLQGLSRAPRRRGRHLSKPARRDRARADRGFRRIRSGHARDASGSSRPLHLSGRAGDAGRFLGVGSCRGDFGQRQCRPDARGEPGTRCATAAFPIPGIPPTSTTTRAPPRSPVG